MNVLPLNRYFFTLIPLAMHDFFVCINNGAILVLKCVVISFSNVMGKDFMGWRGRG